MSPAITKACPERAAGGAQAAERNRAVVCLNIIESRTRNIVRELQRRGCEVVEFYSEKAWGAPPRLRPYLKALRQADFVLCGVPVRSQIFWMLLAKLLGVPCVVDSPMDCTEWPFATAWHCRWGVRLVLKLADYVLTLRSRLYFVDKFGLKRERVLYVENCPDRKRVEASVEAGTSRYQARPGSFLICCSGCHPAHRLERFMPAFQSLLTMVPDAELLLIGDLNQPSIVESMQYAEANGFEERVHALPVIRPTEDFYATLAQCHMWVATLGDDTLQGRHELRMELLEAGLLGKAVISAPTPGLIEHGLADGAELIYIDPTDPSGSAQKIAGFARKPQLLAALGEGLRACVIERFSLSDAVDQLLQVVSGRPSRKRASKH